MNIRRTAILAAGLAAASPTVGGAQSIDGLARRWSVRTAAGVSVLTGSAGDETNMGFAALVAPEIRVGRGPIRLGLELSVGRYGLDSEAVSDPSERLEGDVDIFGLALTGTYELPASGRIAPFERAGVGPYGVQVSVEAEGGGSDTRDETDLGFFGGVGAELRGSRFSPFIEARYQSISSSGERTNFIPIVIGLRF